VNEALEQAMGVDDVWMEKVREAVERAANEEAKIEEDDIVMRGARFSNVRSHMKLLHEKNKEDPSREMIRSLTGSLQTMQDWREFGCWE
jgi:hypothetical protein